MSTPGGQKHTFWPKITQNIGIIQINSQFEPFDNAKLHSAQSMMVFLQNKCQNSGGKPIYRHPGGQIPKCWPKMTSNMGIMQINSQFESFDSTN